MTVALAVLAVLLMMVMIGLVGFLIKLVKDLKTNLCLDPSASFQEVLKGLQITSSMSAKVVTDLETHLAESRHQFARLVILLDRMQTDVKAGSGAARPTEASGALVEADQVHVQADQVHVVGESASGTAVRKPRKRPAPKKPRS